MIKKPKVSVILTTYNRPQFLQRAVDSVLSQTMQEFELIIVDDGSDQSPNVKLPPGEDRVIPIRLHWNTGFWIRPRNIGVMLSRANYIANLDDDNVYAPNHLEVLYEAIKDDQADVVYGDRIYRSANPNETKFMGVMSFDYDLKKINKGNYIDISDIMYTQHIINEVGFYDTNWNRKADWLMMRRFGEHNARIKHVKEVITEYWWHDDNIGQKHPLGGKFIHDFKSQDGKWK